MLTMTFKGVPLPPSSNNQYKSFLRAGKIRHASSTELIHFKRSMDFYFLSNMDLVKFAREAFAGYPLAVHVDFSFEGSRLLSKKGTFKKVDVSNRLKALHDAFANALLIDDCAFVQISARKMAIGKKENEGCEVTIEPCDFVEIQDSGILESPNLSS